MLNNNNIKISCVEDVYIAVLDNESLCDAVSIENAGIYLRDLIIKKQPKKVIIDFRDVKFFSSQAIGMLVNTWKLMDSRQGKLVISGINPQLSRVFRITNLDKIFDFFPDRDTALEMINK